MVILVSRIHFDGGGGDGLSISVAIYCRIRLSEALQFPGGDTTRVNISPLPPLSPAGTDRSGMPPLDACLA